jgi:hypothetical protein|tara:strand:- start:638 stop:874 length:237 start_codon:yes stop_codon:yes gene_type:complete
MSLTKKDLQQSIVIVIERDGTHHIKLPNNDDLEFEPKAYKAMVNTLTVLDEPSFVLKTVLWIERKVQALNTLLFGASA